MQRLRPLSEEECYLRCYGSRGAEDTVRVVQGEVPAAAAPSVLAERIRLLFEAALDGRVHLPHYRGRSCYGFPAQAAERSVREQTGLPGVFDVRVTAIERDDSVWHARVEAGGTAYDVDVHRELGEATHLTCSAEQLKRPTHYVAGTPRVRAA